MSIRCTPRTTWTPGEIIIRGGYRGAYSYMDIDRSPDGKATHRVPKGSGLYLPDAK